MNVSLNGKNFRPVFNKNGEVSDETIFHYHQEGKIIWAEYSGGRISKGFLIGRWESSTSIKLVYQHLNCNNEILTGECRTQVTINNSGKIVLTENWKWTCKDYSAGESTLVEI
ncbi:MAG: n-acetylglutamate synthase [Bacteroidales bacterium]|nr:n-acetylglutamate synthase [Bacteroidales bacterium]